MSLVRLRDASLCPACALLRFIRAPTHSVVHRIQISIDMRASCGLQVCRIAALMTGLGTRTRSSQTLQVLSGIYKFLDIPRGRTRRTVLSGFPCLYVLSRNCRILRSTSTPQQCTLTLPELPSGAVVYLYAALCLVRRHWKIPLPLPCRVNTTDVRADDLDSQIDTWLGCEDIPSPLLLWLNRTDRARANEQKERRLGAGGPAAARCGLAAASGPATWAQMMDALQCGTWSLVSLRAVSCLCLCIEAIPRSCRT